MAAGCLQSGSATIDAVRQRAGTVALTLVVAVLVASGCAGRSGSESGSSPLRFRHQPYLGVACHGGGVACGRIGIAIWLRQPAASVSATLLGTTIRLASSHDGSGDYGYQLFWTGFVHVRPAQIRTLERYPLRVQARRGSTRLDAQRAVLLSAGWG